MTKKKPRDRTWSVAGTIELDASPHTHEDTPRYSDGVFEKLIRQGVENASLQTLMIKDFRTIMKRLVGFQTRAEKSERALAKLTRENAIYSLFKKGLTQREIAEATGLAHTQINLLLKRLRREREGHLGTAGDALMTAPRVLSPNGNPRKFAYEAELKAFAAGGMSSEDYVDNLVNDATAPPISHEFPKGELELLEYDPNDPIWQGPDES